ncbi:MAG: hypothetical protein H6714_09025 [Myxococcales bacterium]|nr:hypothetical protein [Myxococcales bacterium]
MLLQASLPVSYYIMGDRNDERFAWRMFSMVRMERCRPELHEKLSDGNWRVLRHGAFLHPAWVGVVARKRKPVMKALLWHLCEKRRPALEMRIKVDCVGIEGVKNHSSLQLRCPGELP